MIDPDPIDPGPTDPDGQTGARKEGPRTGIRMFPDHVTRLAGSLWTSAAALVLVAGLTLAGLVTGFPDWWQVVVTCTGALISTLMLFLLQHTANRQNNAVLVKLDELVSATSGASEEVIDIEDRQVRDQELIHDELHHDGGPGRDRDGSQVPPRWESA